MQKTSMLISALITYTREEFLTKTGTDKFIDSPLFPISEEHKYVHVLHVVPRKIDSIGNKLTLYENGDEVKRDIVTMFTLSDSSSNGGLTRYENIDSVLIENGVVLGRAIHISNQDIFSGFLSDKMATRFENRAFDFSIMVRSSNNVRFIFPGCRLYRVLWDWRIEKQYA